MGMPLGEKLVSAEMLKFYPKDSREEILAAAAPEFELLAAAQFYYKTYSLLYDHKCWLEVKELDAVDFRSPKDKACISSVGSKSNPG
jgi:hypothetical protein